MHPHLFGLAFGLPLAPPILEVADELLLLGIDRDDRVTLGQEGGTGGSNVGELRISVGMVTAFAGLAIGLQAIASRLQELSDQLMTGAMTPLAQGGRQLAHALASPAQGAFRVTASGRLDQGFQVGQQGGVNGAGLLAAAAGPADAGRGGGGGPPGVNGSPTERGGGKKQW